jgi:uncharacterized protein (DUF362 family)
VSGEIDRRTILKAGAAAGIGVVLPIVWPLGAGAAQPAAIDLASVKGPDPALSTATAIEALGGMSRFVPRGATVGLLINHQFRHAGAHAHPGVALTVVRLCFEAGAQAVLSLKEPRFGYWPAGGQGVDAVRRMTACSGNYITVELPKGQALKQAEIVKEYLAADILVNVSIAKHHEGTEYACVLKNAMGALTYDTCRFFHHGHGKGGWYGDVEFLSQCVADLNRLRRPDLAVADATTILVSNGPFGPGKIARPGVVVAGADPVAVDAFAARFLGLDGGKVAMIARSAALGLGEMDLEKVRRHEIAL